MVSNYFKVIGITIDAISAEIIVDGNVKDVDDISSYIKENNVNNKNITWVVMPCICKI